MYSTSVALSRCYTLLLWLKAIDANAVKRSLQAGVTGCRDPRRYFQDCTMPSEDCHHGLCHSLYTSKSRGSSFSISHQCYMMNTADLLTLYRLYCERADASSLCQAFGLLLAAQELLSPGEQTLQDEGTAYISHGSSVCVQVASKASFCATTDFSAMAICHWASEQPVTSLCCMMRSAQAPQRPRSTSSLVHWGCAPMGYPRVLPRLHKRPRFRQPRACPV